MVAKLREKKRRNNYDSYQAEQSQNPMARVHRPDDGRGFLLR